MPHSVLTVHCVTGERNAAASTVQQRLVFVGKDAGKGFALRDLLRGGGLKAPILVFVSSSERAKQLHRWRLPWALARADTDLQHSEDVVRCL